MTLRELIKFDFDIDLPIRGGKGNSIDDPIIFEYDQSNRDYVGCEYTLLQCIGKGRGIKWEMLSQTLLAHNDRKIDQVKIEVQQIENGEEFTVVENYYFDITEYY